MNRDSKGSFWEMDFQEDAATRVFSPHVHKIF
jgi:hypothetical protein